MMNKRSAMMPHCAACEVALGFLIAFALLAIGFGFGKFL